MDQKNIRDHNGTAFTVPEASEWLKELDDRTNSSQTGYNSIDELAKEAKKTSNINYGVLGGGLDFNWKKFVGITFNNQNYSGANFDLLIITPDSNFGHSSLISKYYYRLSCSRSGATLDSNNTASIYGIVNDYVRIIKVSSSYYEVQIRQVGQWKKTQAKIKALENSNATITYHDLTENGVTSGTVINVTRPTVKVADNFIDLNANVITCVTLAETSDKNCKDNIEVVDGEWALSVFKKLRFSLYDNKLSSRKDAGLIAQEVEKIIPEAVHTDSNGRKALNYRYVDTIKSAAIQHFIKTQLQ